MARTYDQIVKAQGWDDGSLVDILYEYIENQSDMATFIDFLEEKAAEENEESTGG